MTPSRTTVLAATAKEGWQPLTVHVLRRAVFVAGVKTYYNKLPSDLAGYLQRVVFKDTLLPIAFLDDLSDADS